MSTIDIERKNPPAGYKPQFITAPPLDREKDWDIRSLAIDISGSCNMACRYCAEAVTMPKRQLMSADTLDKVWQFFFPDGAGAFPREKDGKKLTIPMFSIHLGSGEPLINFKLMRQVGELVREARQQGLDNIEVFITTNASLLDEEIIDCLMDSDWNVKVSFDGPASVHDTWRVLPGGAGTYERAVKALAYMVKKKPERVTACAVLCRGTDPAEVAKAVEELGICRLDMAPVAHTDEAIIPGSGDLENYRKFINGYAARFNGGDNEPTMVINNFNQCMMRLMGYKKARMICTAGRFYLGVGPEGDIYPCGRFIGVDRYRLGHISSGLEPAARMAFLKDGARPYDRREPCSDCWAAPLCTGPCFAVAEMFGKGGGRPLDYQCAYILETARAAFSLYTGLKENNPEGLLAFLPTLHDSVFN